MITDVFMMLHCHMLHCYVVIVWPGLDTNHMNVVPRSTMNTNGGTEN